PRRTLLRVLRGGEFGSVHRGKTRRGQTANSTPQSTRGILAASPMPITRSLAADFPILRQRIRGKPLVYLDNAATTHKPRAVIDRVARFYEDENANVHRGVHTLSERATDAYEQARAAVGRFLNARHADEIVFVRGTTEAINLVASTYGRTHV